MSLTTGFIAIKGQHLDNLPGIVHHFNLIDTGQDTIVDNWLEAEVVLEEEYSRTVDDITERHVTWQQNGWTVLEDLTFTLCTNEEALEKITAQLNTPILSVLAQGTSNCFGFWYFDKIKLRAFLIEDGIVSTNYGKPLPGEEKYNINENGFYDDVLGVAKESGIDWHTAENYPPFIVKTFEANDEYRAQQHAAVLEYRQQQEAMKANQKPWWKFW